MKVLLSIKPEFVEKIFCGEKRYEYRKSVFKNKEVNTIIVYSTMPVGRIVGEFKIKKVHRDAPSQIWEKTSEYSGVEENFYKQYFKGRAHGFAIEISSYTLYDSPIDPKEMFDNFTAPQSFSYIEDYDELLADRKNMCVVRHYETADV